MMNEMTAAHNKRNIDRLYGHLSPGQQRMLFRVNKMAGHVRFALDIIRKMTPKLIEAKPHSLDGKAITDLHRDVVDIRTQNQIIYECLSTEQECLMDDADDIFVHPNVEPICRSVDELIERIGAAKPDAMDEKAIARLELIAIRIKALMKPIKDGTRPK